MRENEQSTLELVHAVQQTTIALQKVSRASLSVVFFFCELFTNLLCNLNFNLKKRQPPDFVIACESSNVECMEF